jgi:hypothetical protein
MKLCVAAACCVAALALAAPTGLAAGKGGGTKVVCVNGKTLHREYKREPGRCVFHKHGQPMAEAFFVRAKRIHWHAWRHGHARGKGREVPPLGHREAPVRIRLSHPVRRCGHRAFTKAHFFFPKVGRGSTMRLDACA